MSIKVLHTADWQIGKMFSNMPEASAYLRDQRIETIKTIANLAKERQVDVVVVAGDVFEDNAVHDRTLVQTVHAMSAFSGPWLLLPGNHDAAVDESVWTRLAAVKTENIFLLTTAEPMYLCDRRLVVLPAPLKRRHDSSDLTEWFDNCQTEPGAIRLGLAHGSMANRLPERSESFNNISDLRAKQANLDYLALGDWHGTLNIADKTWYSGTHEQDRFRSKDAGNVLIATFSAAGAPCQVEKIKTGHYRWCQLELDLVGEDGPSKLNDALKDLGQPEDRFIVDLKLCGTLDLAKRAELDRVLLNWQALFKYFDCDDSGLVASASADDLDNLSDGGFVSQAARKLKEIAENPQEPRQNAARLALQILYSEQLKLSTVR